MSNSPESYVHFTKYEQCSPPASWIKKNNEEIDRVFKIMKKQGGIVSLQFDNLHKCHYPMGGGSVCGKLGSLSDLHNHIMVHHLNMIRYFCDRCKGKYGTKVYLIHHQSHCHHDQTNIKEFLWPWNSEVFDHKTINCFVKEASEEEKTNHEANASRKTVEARSKSPMYREQSVSAQALIADPAYQKFPEVQESGNETGNLATTSRTDLINSSHSWTPSLTPSRGEKCGGSSRPLPHFPSRRRSSSRGPSSQAHSTTPVMQQQANPVSAVPYSSVPAPYSSVQYFQNTSQFSNPPPQPTIHNHTFANEAIRPATLQYQQPGAYMHGTSHVPHQQDPGTIHAAYQQHQAFGHSSSHFPAEQRHQTQAYQHQQLPVSEQTTPHIPVPQHSLAHKRHHDGSSSHTSHRPQHSMQSTSSNTLLQNSSSRWSAATTSSVPYRPESEKRSMNSRTDPAGSDTRSYSTGNSKIPMTERVSRAPIRQEESRSERSHSRVTLEAKRPRDHQKNSRGVSYRTRSRSSSLGDRAGPVSPKYLSDFYAARQAMESNISAGRQDARSTVPVPQRHTSRVGALITDDPMKSADEQRRSTEEDRRARELAHETQKKEQEERKREKRKADLNRVKDRLWRHKGGSSSRPRSRSRSPSAHRHDSQKPRSNR